MIPLLIAISLVAGCTTHKEKSSPADRKAQIEDLILQSKAGLTSLSDPNSGWPSITDCDGTLWAGLACAGGHAVEMGMAEYKAGEIHRRPAPSCWNQEHGDVGSVSTVSNDMLLGYMLCKWERKDLSAFERLAKFGEENNWVMGKPASEATRVVMRPNGMGLLGRAIYALSNGKDSRDYRHIPPVYVAAPQDFERHLAVLGIVLYGEITEQQADDVHDLVDVRGDMLGTLEDLADLEPKNPGYQTALGIYTGEMDQAIDLFLDPSTPIPSYVRGDKPDAFMFAERLFWLTRIHKRMKE